MSAPREPREPRDPYEPDGAAWGRPPAGGWGDDPGRGEYGYPEYGNRDHGHRDDDPYGGDPRYGWSPPQYEPAAPRAGPPPPAGPRSAPAPERQPPSWGPGYALTTPRRPARRRRPPWVALAVAGVAVVAVLVLGFVAPGWFVTRVLSAPAVQTGVAKILTDDYGAEGVADVRCPVGVGVTAGATFTCDATIDGDPVTVPVRVTDGDGGYEVGRPT